MFCSLLTGQGSELVGVYSVAHGRISDARHYFSDVELLERVGIVQPGPVGGAATAHRS